MSDTTQGLDSGPHEKSARSKGPWIIATSVLLAAMLVVGSLFFFSNRAKQCRRWEEALESELAILEHGAGGQFLADVVEKMARERGYFTDEGNRVYRPSYC